MHEDETHTLINNIFRCEKIIYQQQLNQEWEEPFNPLVQNFTNEKDQIEEKINDFDKKTQTLFDKLLEDESELYKQNLCTVL